MAAMTDAADNVLLTLFAIQNSFVPKAAGVDEASLSSFDQPRRER